MSKRRAEASFDKGGSNSNDSLADLALVTSPNKRQRTKVAANNSPEPNSHDLDWDGCSNESRADPKKGENLNPSDENSGSNTNLTIPDANLMDNDEAHLASLFGKERQQELCQQNERSKAMSKRFEIEFPKQQETSSSISNIDEEESGFKAEKQHQYESTLPDTLSLIQNIAESPQIYSVLPTGTKLTLIEQSGQNSSDSESGDLVICLKKKDVTSASVEKKVKTQKIRKPYGRPTRGQLSILDRRLMELLAPYRVLHQGRKQITYHPGDVRRLSIITGATLLLLRITDLTLPDDLSGLPKLFRETSRMAIELSRNGLHPGSPVEPFPPNMVLLTGLRGLLVESTRVDPYPEDFDEGDPIIDEFLMTIMKSFFGGWARPIFVLFALNGLVPAKTNENSNMGDPEAAEIFMNADNLPNGIIPCSSGAGDVNIGDGDEKAGGAIERTPKRSTRIKTPAKLKSSPRDIQRTWTEGDKEKLLSVFENDGFDGDFSNLAKRLSHRSPESLRYLVEYLLSERATMEWEAEVDSKIDNLYGTYQSILNENFQLVLTLISLYGRFPNPSEVGGIEYSKIYSYVASLMRGQIPQNVGMATKKKLFQVFSRFRGEVIASQEIYNFPGSFEIKSKSKFEENQFLFERRSEIWSEEEMRARSIIESGDLQEIKLFFRSHAVLNPFF